MASDALIAAAAIVAYMPIWVSGRNSQPCADGSTAWRIALPIGQSRGSDMANILPAAAVEPARVMMSFRAAPRPVPYWYEPPRTIHDSPSGTVMNSVNPIAAPHSFVTVGNS